MTTNSTTQRRTKSTTDEALAIARTAARLEAKAHPDGTTRLYRGARADLEELRALDVAIAKLSKRRGEIRQAVQRCLEEADVSRGTVAGRVVVELKVIPTTRVDVVALREQEEAIAERFTVTGERRVLDFEGPW